MLVENYDKKKCKNNVIVDTYKSNECNSDISLTGKYEGRIRMGNGRLRKDVVNLEERKAGRWWAVGREGGMVNRNTWSTGKHIVQDNRRSVGG